MRVLFLDIDGVLNSKPYFIERGPGWMIDREQADDIDPAAVRLLNTLIARTGAAIVISSTWRYFGQQAVTEMLKARGLEGAVIGVTPRSEHGVRGREIQQWLANADAPIESFVILDDDSDMEHLMPRLVRTSFERGLLPADVERAVALFEGA